jgi:hypothetical protein
MMILWVPVLGHDQVLKEPGQPMDHGHHILAAWHREGASITEVILYVDHQHHVAVNQFYTHSLILTHYRQPISSRTPNHSPAWRAVGPAVPIS